MQNIWGSKYFNGAMEECVLQCMWVSCKIRKQEPFLDSFWGFHPKAPAIPSHLSHDEETGQAGQSQNSKIQREFGRQREK